MNAEERAELRRQQDAVVSGELKAVGLEVSSIFDLLQMKGYKNAIPVLLSCLERVTEPLIRETIFRALGDKSAKGLVEERLIKEYESLPFDADGQRQRWVIGNSLESIATNAIAEDLMRFAADPRYGSARQMVVLALGRVGDSRAIALLRDLLADEDVCGHAVIALGRLKATEARDQIKALTNHPKAWIRSEALRAIKRIGS